MKWKIKATRMEGGKLDDTGQRDSFPLDEKLKGGSELYMNIWRRVSLQRHKNVIFPFQIPFV